LRQKEKDCRQRRGLGRGRALPSSPAIQDPRRERGGSAGKTRLDFLQHQEERGEGKKAGGKRGRKASRFFCSRKKKTHITIGRAEEGNRKSRKKKNKDVHTAAQPKGGGFLKRISRNNKKGNKILPFLQKKIHNPICCSHRGNH